MGWRRRKQVKKSGKGCIEGRGKGWWEVGKGRGRRGGRGRGRKRQERERGQGEKGRERVKKGEREILGKREVFISKISSFQAHPLEEETKKRKKGEETLS